MRSTFLSEHWHKFRGSENQPLLARGPQTNRPELLSLALLAVVVMTSSLFAHYFKETALLVIGWYSGSEDPTVAASTLSRLEVFGVVLLAILLGAWLGRTAQSRWSDRVGLHAIAATTRGDDRSISFRATMIRSAGTWFGAAGLVSIGRESAIIETGGAIGSSLGRRFGGRGAALSAGGIAAAFAAAYHAPIAALFYVEEHLRARSNRRTTAYAVIGAIGGHLLTVNLLGGTTIFPAAEGPRLSVLHAALFAVVPAALSARVFLELRVRVTSESLATRFRWHPLAPVIVLGIVGGMCVVIAPSIAGNGMEGLRRGAVGPTVTLMVALSVFKLVGTAASLGSGMPGGMLTPTITVSAGSAGLTMLALGNLGISTGPVWDGMLAAMAIAIAVGLRSPIVAVFLIAEMVGDLTLVPIFTVVVVLAWLLDRGLDRFLLSTGETLPTGVHDADA